MAGPLMGAGHQQKLLPMNHFHRGIAGINSADTD